ncbi:dipeptide/oligopeptide/nickel ABC transporter permease/ATP-binding protein [Corynebacterium ammoniagenes]|uniref:ABC transporter ATP-binding protein n=2 Tax=Corynebacterium ammoniagenes TaxID=1697 RepID=A0AAV5G8D2_CORAM|nr:ABC transporter [Corynebacterium ammoniagenes]EFG81464.1 ABC transporter, ATP-binding protein [Corynebacterium ammoniagenes DSM 20306]GJN43592.1 ABC transporter ATP-binding protein [Corynebacterium ammoniagenes]
MTSKKQKLQAMEDNAGKVRFRRWNAMSFGSKLSIIVLGIVALSAIFAPLLAPHDPQAITMKGLEPSGENLFGTDHLGRDVLSRLLYGGRYSLLVGLASTGIALAIAVILGSIAAVSRKGMDELIMRIMDVIMSVPAIALAAVTVVVFRDPSNPESLIWVIIGSIAFVYIPQLTRIVRANVLSEYGKDYVNAVVVAGARAPWILARHVMRNCAAPVLVFATLLVADAIILEASLTFIGAGLQEPIATWGNILSAAQPGVLRGEWWQALFPGVMIMLTVLCLNIVSEGITDAMVAAPTGPAKTKPSKNVEREQDKLLSDSAVAHAAQKESLDKRIAELKRVEALRDDRQKAPEGSPVLLEVKNLCIKFPRHGDVNVVDNVSFTVGKGETMALVGESGCGKSITAFAIMGLIDPKAEVSGEALYEGRDLLSMPHKERQSLLGHELAMVYQDALSSLNPGMLIKAQMKQLTSRGGTRSAEELMELVGLEPKRTLESYPHELSGGQRQRVLIAMALTRDPKLVIADEPTTALDVTVQKQVIELLNDLRDKLGFAMVFVSHDLALVAEVAHKVTVMYAGQVVEQGTSVELLTNPVHEYTRGLLGAVLSIEAASGRLHQIPGVVPSPRDFPAGDRFAPRSSHPGYGEDITPVRTQVGAPETEHTYAAIPDQQTGVISPGTPVENTGSTTTKEGA